MAPEANEEAAATAEAEVEPGEPLRLPSGRRWNEEAGTDIISVLTQWSLTCHERGRLWPSPDSR
jgi:hypothetical protein